MLTEIGLLDKKGQYIKIKVLQRSRGIEQIKVNAVRQEREARSRLLANTAFPTPNNENPFSILSPTPPSSTKANNNLTSMSLKGDKQGFIALSHNSVFYACIKHIDIQHYYTRDKVASGRIHMQYIPMSEMIADGMMKALTHDKFYFFVKEIHIS